MRRTYRLRNTVFFSCQRSFSVGQIACYKNVVKATSHSAIFCVCKQEIKDTNDFHLKQMINIDRDDY